MIFMQAVSLADTGIVRADSSQARQAESDISFASFMNKAQSTGRTQTVVRPSREAPAAETHIPEDEPDSMDADLAAQGLLQSVQLTQTIQDTQAEPPVIDESAAPIDPVILEEPAAQDIQEAPAVQGTQDASQAQGEQDAKEQTGMPDLSAAQVNRDTPAAQGNQDAPAAQGNQEVAKARDTGDTQTAQGIQDSARPQVKDDVTTQAVQDTPEDFKAALVSVLEGKMEITDSKQAQDNKTQALAQEDEARMPTRTQDKLPVSAAETDGNSCPLENENDSEATAGQKEAGTRAAPETGEEETKPKAAQSFQLGQTLDIAPDRVSSNIGLRDAAESAKPAAQVTTDNLFDAMVEQVELNQTADTSRMTIKLKPDFLGNVSLQLTMGEGGMQVKINAEDANVKSMIGSQISALVETLENRGIKIAAVEVAYTGVSDGHFMDSKNGGNGARRDSDTGNSGRMRETPGAGFIIDLPSASAVMQTLDPEISSVEYSA